MPPDIVRLVVDAIPSMLAYWDHSQRCVFANRAYERWFGVTPQSLVGRTMKELLGPIYPLNLPHIKAVLRGERQEFERVIPDPAGGPPRHSLAVYIPNIVDGQVQGFCVLVSEVTEQKKVELELRGALAKVKTLTGLLPICAWCKKVREGTGYWTSLEKYVTDNSTAQITHGMCEACAEQYDRDET